MNELREISLDELCKRYVDLSKSYYPIRSIREGTLTRGEPFPLSSLNDQRLRLVSLRRSKFQSFDYIGMLLPEDTDLVSSSRGDFRIEWFVGETWRYPRNLFQTLHPILWDLSHTRLNAEKNRLKTRNFSSKTFKGPSVASVVVFDYHNDDPKRSPLAYKPIITAVDVTAYRVPHFSPYRLFYLSEIVLGDEGIYYCTDREAATDKMKRYFFTPIRSCDNFVNRLRGNR